MEQYMHYLQYIHYGLFFFFFDLFYYFVVSFLELFVPQKIIIKKNYVLIKIHVSFTISTSLFRIPRPCHHIKKKKKNKDKGVCGCRIPPLSMNQS